MERPLGDRSPGILGLVRLLEEHGEAIEFDLPRYWPGRSLHELATGEMTWRELRTFVRHLPRESAYIRSVHGDLVEWGVAEQLQATQINDARLYYSGKKSLPESKLVKPPGDKNTGHPHDRPAQKAGGLKELNALFNGR